MPFLESMSDTCNLHLAWETLSYSSATGMVSLKSEPDESQELVGNNEGLKALEMREPLVGVCSRG